MNQYCCTYIISAHYDLHCLDFVSCVNNLYGILPSMTIKGIESIRINSYINNTKYIQYRVECNHGIYLVSDNSRIKLSDLFPHMTVIDTIISNTIGTVQTTKTSVHTGHGGITRSNVPIVTSNVGTRPSFPSMSTYTPKFGQPINLTQPVVELRGEQTASTERPVTEIEPQPPVTETKPEPKLTADQQRFLTNKKMYIKIIDDIEGGDLNENNINEMFSEEYEIFSILENRDMLDIENEEFDEKEFTQYMAMSKAVSDDYVASISNNIYLPTNYETMTYSEKVLLAKKYNMDVTELDNVYKYKSTR